MKKFIRLLCTFFLVFIVLPTGYLYVNHIRTFNKWGILSAVLYVAFAFTLSLWSAYKASFSQIEMDDDEEEKDKIVVNKNPEDLYKPGTGKTQPVEIDGAWLKGLMSDEDCMNYWVNQWPEGEFPYEHIRFVRREYDFPTDGRKEEYGAWVYIYECWKEPTPTPKKKQ